MMSVSRWAAVGLSVVVSAVGAGPLDPPPGPVAPTGKPLAEIEPRIAINATNTPGDNDSTPSLFQIAQPGSYYLAADTVVPEGLIGIEVAATTGSVTIDLNGFRLQGTGVVAGAHGIDLGRANNVTIRNGSIIGFGGYGILGPNSDSCRLEDLRVQQSREAGARLGSGAIVTRCEFSSNGLGNGANTVGCEVGLTSVVSSSIFRNNLGDGLHADDGCTVTDCAARSNAHAGIAMGVAGTVRNCTARENLINGFAVGPHSTVRDCVSYLNTGYGFGGGASITFSGCNARDNTGNGFSGGAGTNFHDCIAAGNDGVGINANLQAVVDGCTASNNQGAGISCGGTITNNHVQFNFVDGIVASSSALVSGNSCNNNGVGTGVTTGANIRVTAFNVRVENNTCTGADLGIASDVSNCIIIRNTCSSNTTNYSVPAGASIGTIINLSGGIDITTSNSFANFEY
ncbi:MAG: right-handed parallel beta-helix repeat-containing protein [Phycisphaeraceae bacterium]|nr:MAG: right-handed parallel beta-helix repeat-containing protein [Phycisphaeraceae bacterium]